MTAYHADSSDLVVEEVLTWQGFGDATRGCRRPPSPPAASVPEIVIAIARGGLLLAGGLAYALGLKNWPTRSTSSSTPTSTPPAGPGAAGAPGSTSSRSGANGCWWWTTSPTGRTLALVLDLLRDLGAEPRSAVLYAKPTASLEPDFVWRRTADWIVFPWSAEPPVTG